jgi:hypothetical protein
MAKNLSLYMVAPLAHNDILLDTFNLPISMVAAGQCQEQLQLLGNSGISLNNQKDKWNFPWSNEKYSTKKVYLVITKRPTTPALFKWI